MRYPIPILCEGTLRARRTVPPILAMILLALIVLNSPNDAYGDMFRIVGPTRYGDDVHSATANPYPATAVSTITYAGHPELTGQCAWINSGLGAFSAANTLAAAINRTPGTSGQVWTFNWAGVAAEARVEAGIRILDYFPYVVTQPAITAGDRTRYPRGPTGELGGAVLNLSYTPQAGAPAINNFHWIQAYTGTRRGEAVPALLDNDPAHPYTAQSSVTPFYDDVYAAGTLPRGGGWFLDRPLINENEYEGDPVASVQFQVILANDVRSLLRDRNGNLIKDKNGRPIIQNTVTLYGGEWWGFTYSAEDRPTPEPASCFLMALGGGGLLFFRRMTGWMRAA